MKILTIAIPNHHFFQWVNQLEDSGYEVFWFDISDSAASSPKIPWVTQFKGWKLRWDFPFRSGVKARFPELYKWLQRYNENDANYAFAKAYQEIQPDIVHCFEMELAGLPILPALKEINVPLIYSSWGSDLYYFVQRGIPKERVIAFLKRVNYLITDCRRDYKMADDLGYTQKFLGVFPGNGGINLPAIHIKAVKERTILLIKGYDDGVGKASIVLEALERVDQALLSVYEIIIYSGDDILLDQIKKSAYLSALGITFNNRNRFIDNELLLEKMGEAQIHIANSISDGMPNAMLEAMGMGAFPIQSNPGGASAEVIMHNKNGLLIDNPLDPNEIAQLLTKAIVDSTLREEAKQYNMDFIKTNYSREALKPKIVSLYNQIYEEHKP